MFITWQNRESSITLMESVYRDLNSKEAAFLFYFFYATSFILNVLYYPYGFFAMARKNVRIIKIYTQFTLVFSMLTIVLIYLNM